MATTRAYLYDSNLQPLGKVGVVGRVMNDFDGPPGRDYDVALFPDWPASLSEGVAFAVRIDPADSRRRWRSPQEVWQGRLIGMPETEDLAAVVLDGPSEVSTRADEGTLSDDPDIDRLGLRRLVADRIETRDNRKIFSDLENPVDAGTDLTDRGVPRAAARAVRDHLETPNFTRSRGNRRVVARGICRFFRWD
jgi:hypothetical protein